MNAQQNARLTPIGRSVLAQRVDRGWSVTAAARAAGVSARTAHIWLKRHRQGGERRYHDRGWAPRRCPHATPVPRIAAIEALRRRRLSGPQIAAALDLGSDPAPPGIEPVGGVGAEARDRALAWCGRLGITVERVMTDNGSASRSKRFAAALAKAGVRHPRTRPYTPRTNGKAERFIQTSRREWAYARPYQSPARAPHRHRAMGQHLQSRHGQG